MNSTVETKIQICEQRASLGHEFISTCKIHDVQIKFLTLSYKKILFYQHSTKDL